MQVLGALADKVLNTPVLSLIIGLVSLVIAQTMGLFTKRLDVKGKVRIFSLLLPSEVLC